MNDPQVASSSAPEPSTWGEWLKENRLDDLLSLPKEVARQPWRPTDSDRVAAWALYTEMRTRISTQRLNYGAGVEQSALDSIVTLFQTTRDLLRDHGPECRHFATIAVRVLNGEIRPFTTLWHKQVVAGRLKTEDGRRMFRQELRVLQSKLDHFQRFLGLLAEGDEFQEKSESGLKGVKDRKDLLGQAIPFDRLLELKEPEKETKSETKYGQTAAATPEQIRTLESREISQRRGTDPDQRPENLIGLAISGGGIRSATFALGVLQGLAPRRLLPEIDLMSTVSGGGYLGAMLSSYLNNDDPEIGLGPEQFPFVRKDKCEASPLRFLRNHSSYLLSHGFVNRLTVIGQALYGVLMNLLILAPLLFLAVLITRYVYHDDLITIASAFRRGVADSIDWTFGRMTAVACIVWAVFGGFVLVLPVVQARGRRTEAGREMRRTYELRCVRMFGLTLLVSAIAAIPWGYYLFLKLNLWLGLISSVELSFGWRGLVAAAVNLIAFLSARGWMLPRERTETKQPVQPNPFKRLVVVLLWLSGPLLAIAMYFVLSHEFVVSTTAVWRDLLLWALVLVPLAYTVILNVNFISPHRYYRNRLAETYLLQNVSADHQQAQAVDPQLLSGLNKTAQAPYHLINGALNLPNSTASELRGRDSDFFLFSKHVCGSPILGYFPTPDWEQLDSHLDLGTAMAISGAAASSHMGTNTPRGASFFLTLLNVRLGYWLRRPDVPVRFPGLVKWLDGTQPGPLYLLREMVAKVNEQRAFVNVSDGGHIENLGIYELLRRRCKFIIAIDGEADPNLEFPSLMRLIQFAWIDFGVKVEIDVTRLRLTEDHFSQAHFALGTITYPEEVPVRETENNPDIDQSASGMDVNAGAEVKTGFLLYIKLSATGNEPDYVLDYRAKNPTFPHQTTADQLFSEDQFEAYRALGAHVAGDLFDAELMEGVEGDLTVETWFQTLARNLLATA